MASAENIKTFVAGSAENPRIENYLSANLEIFNRLFMASRRLDVGWLLSNTIAVHAATICIACSWFLGLSAHEHTGDICVDCCDCAQAPDTEPAAMVSAANSMYFASSSTQDRSIVTDLSTTSTNIAGLLHKP